MTWSQPTAITTPPPLPVPGTGGFEEIPARAIPGTHPQRSPDGTLRAEHRPHLSRGRCGSARSLPIVVMVLVSVWAISGGGFFWPIWAIIGWSVMIGAKGSHPAVRRSRHRGDW